MKTRSQTNLAVIAALLFLGATGAACGSRTGLLSSDVTGDPNAATDGAIGDASSIDMDTSFEIDAPLDIDATPGLDVQNRPDVIAVNECPDAAATLVYVVTEEDTLYSFYPPTSSFRPIGTLHCRPTMAGAHPFSMAVNRAGTAYVLYSDGELFQVSTATAACVSTRFSIGAFKGFTTFGMGYAADNFGGGETLFVAADSQTNGPSPQLGFIDTKNFAVNRVGTFSPVINRAELTGTGGGQLFGFYSKGGSESFIGEIDKVTARVIGEDPLLGVVQGSAWAFAFWGGAFYTFTAPSTSSVVSRFDPATKKTSRAGSFPAGRIVGAGVSTCAPQ